MRRLSGSGVGRPTLSRPAALSLFAASLASVAPLRAQTTLVPVKIATPGGDAFAEPFFGTDNGFFAKAGFDPQISILNNAGAVVAAVAGGTITSASATSSASPMRSKTASHWSSLPAADST